MTQSIHFRDVIPITILEDDPFPVIFLIQIYGN